MTNGLRYSVQDGFLEIRDSNHPEPAWRGSFGDGAVVRALRLPGTEDCIVMVEYAKGNVANNVMRIRPDGTVVWRAQAAPEFGPYVEIAIREDRLMAWSWSGYMVELESSLGSIVQRTFVK
jgi:hypothetical protein